MTETNRRSHKSPAESETTHVRVRTATLARLRASAVALIEAVECDQRSDPGLEHERINPRALALSFDQMINLLLDARDAHHARARKQRQQKQGGGKKGEETAPA